VEDHATWSPDGTEVVFFRTSQDATQFVLLSPDGTERILARCAASPCADVPRTWSPDGSPLAWSLDPGDGSGDVLETYDLATGVRSQICDAACPTNIASLAWSPDGSTIAFSDWTLDRKEAPDNPLTTTIWSIPASGGTASRIGPPADTSRCTPSARPCVEDLGPAWSPDGAPIVFLRWYRRLPWAPA
jgi:Tol biopolymer transport system component